jgi:hypothetical protein
MTKMPEAPPVNFIDNPHAPEVFADAGAGFFLANGNLRITLESARVTLSIESSLLGWSCQRKPPRA